MIYLKWLVLAIVDWFLHLSLIVAAPSVAFTTKPQPHGLAPYSWGWIYGTYDNPPQGDEGFVRERCFFPGVIDGWKGYLNRVLWMIRNPLYGFAKWSAVEREPYMRVSYVGNPNISDKYKIPGWYFAKCYDTSSKVRAFEFYCVLPWGFGKCLRVRLGYKIMTDKFARYGFAQLVNTANPFKSYG